MDRFVTRLPREQKEKKRARAAEPRKTQATIGQLKGVVDMRVAGRLREACLQKPLDAEGIRAALEEIASKNVRQDIMQRLGIAKLLKRLQRCSDADVAALAKDIVARWKETLSEPTVKPKLEVKRGLREEKRRLRVRAHLATVFGATAPYTWDTPRPPEQCAIAIEAALDAKAGHVSDAAKYLGLARFTAVAFAGAPHVRRNMLNGTLDANEIAKMDSSSISQLEEQLRAKAAK